MYIFRKILIVPFLFLGILASGQFYNNADAITINEVLYDAEGVDTGKEWIELFNEDTVSINLTGYDLSADVGNFYAFPDFTLPADSFVVVHWNATDTDTSTDLYTGDLLNAAMSNTKGFVALFSSTTHNSSTIIDYVEYGLGGQTWESDAVTAEIWTAGDFVADVMAGSSIGLQINGLDNNLSSDWAQFDNPTPGSNNEPIPEPSTVALLCIGLLGLGLFMKRKEIVKYFLDTDRHRLSRLFKHKKRMFSSKIDFRSSRK
ncbi:MAG: PEP-CTERM motif protein [Candidatus Scalindua rubra]|uniref:PEP-CTERM motif protein n=1 Tax=Candidatus Scalindua rubra TaxID=1872076 RepID=A0A1E3XC97_9BACT|nr:MAG: PEP-CTERM motif protein [Candidatus Scalindua rubra]